MSDARIILLAKNHQDATLTGNPENTYFKFGTKTHNNFGEDWIAVDFNQVNIANYYIDIPLNGDLLTETIIEVTINDLNPNPAYFAMISSIINEVEFLYNDKVLVRYPIQYLIMKYALQNNISKSDSIRELLVFSEVRPNVYKAYLPLSFWFSECSEKALPIWASQHVRYGIRVKLSSNIDTILQQWTNDEVQPPITFYPSMEMNLLCKYGFLDTEEKRKFQNDSLEYIIEQVEYRNNEINSTEESNIINKKYDLQRINYLTEILWSFSPSRISDQGETVNVFFPIFLNNLKNATILLNGQPIGQDFNEKYYRLVQRYQFHQNGATLNSFASESSFPIYYSSIYSYSFSLNPDDCSKNCGFLTTEKYNNISLELTYDTMTNMSLPILQYNLFICQRKLNIIRIKDGKLNVLFN
jgi:hypothetical protein